MGLYLRRFIEQADEQRLVLIDGNNTINPFNVDEAVGEHEQVAFGLALNLFTQLGHLSQSFFFRIKLHPCSRLLWVISLPETEVVGAIVTL
ncbi:hypothetical protein D3C77_355370 [compost metagenome]